MSNTYNALIHAKQDGTGEEVANNKTGGDGSLYAPVTSIATPENGDTASKAYAVGEMFIRGGKLCTCIVAISSGDTLVKDTNYKEGDVGSVLTELNSKLYELDFDNIYSETGSSNIMDFTPNASGLLIALSSTPTTFIHFSDVANNVPLAVTPQGNANTGCFVSGIVSKGRTCRISCGTGTVSIKFIPYK